MADWERKQLNYDKADEKIREWVAKGDTTKTLNLSKLDLISGYTWASKCYSRFTI